MIRRGKIVKSTEKWIENLVPLHYTFDNFPNKKSRQIVTPNNQMEECCIEIWKSNNLKFENAALTKVSTTSNFNQ